MDKKSRIPHTALLQFSRFVLKKLIIDEITRQDHVTKAAIYRYHLIKQDIFDDVVAYEMNQLLTAITEAVNCTKRM